MRPAYTCDVSPLQDVHGADVATGVPQLRGHARGLDLGRGRTGETRRIRRHPSNYNRGLPALSLCAEPSDDNRTTPSTPVDLVPTVGSMFSGIGGLEMAVEALGARTIWQVEIDPKASEVLATHWPEVPNYQDVSTVEWAEVEAPDILTAGFPCQDISLAGRGAGLAGKRSGLWSEIVTAVRHLRPGIVFVENVSAIVHRGLDAVLADLAEIGYISTWGVFRAADVGACHRRERWFLVATDASGERSQGAESQRIEFGVEQVDGDSGRKAHADADCDGCQGVEEVNGPNGPVDIEHGDDTERRRGGDFGHYGAAIERWSRVTGPPPAPTIRGRLSPDFVEWMMGFPPGWTHGQAKTHRLKMLGNAVVPHQGLAAFGALMDLHTRLEQAV